MNPTAIEWCDYSWNPLTGCLHGCKYCYARKIAIRFAGTKAWPNGFEPTFHQERLNDPLTTKKPSAVFVGSMTDIFGAWNDPRVIADIFGILARAKQHTFILLTKAPENIDRFLSGVNFPGNVWIGVSVEDQSTVYRIDTMLKSAKQIRKFISFEPLLGPIDYDLTGIGGVIIGPRTKPPNLITQEMVEPIFNAALKAGNIPVFCKDKMPEWAKVRRELPWAVRKQNIGGT
jgi:protein gp37